MKFRLAAPSCVVPDRVGANCLVLEHLVDEVALMLLETKSCLEYTSEDLPETLIDLDLSYHAHLPLDLPWNEGAFTVYQAFLGLGQKIAFLHPRGYVLHPSSAKNLAAFFALDSALAKQVLLENIRGHDFQDLASVFREYTPGICLDVGHLVSYGQQAMLEQVDFFSRVRMLHVYGGESARGHAELAEFPDKGLLRAVFENIPTDCVVVVEVFSLAGLRRSLATLREWCAGWRLS